MVVREWAVARGLGGSLHNCRATDSRVRRCRPTRAPRGRPASFPLQVHYTGTLTNGKEFDSSRKRGEARAHARLRCAPYCGLPTRADAAPRRFAAQKFSFKIGLGQVIKGACAAALAATAYRSGDRVPQRRRMRGSPRRSQAGTRAWRA